MESTNKIIPSGWTEITLGEALKYEQPYRYTVDNAVYESKSGVPVLTAGKSFLLGYTNETTNIYHDLPVIIFDDFTTDNKFVDFPFKVKSSAMKFLKPKNHKEHNINFFFAILQSHRIRGSFGDHKRRWISEFSKIKINSPGFEEQNCIAQILSKTDQAIEQTEKLIAKYQRIKTGLMQDLLTKGIDEKGNIRSEKTHRFKTENGIRVPEEWSVECLGNVCSKIQDGTHFSPQTDDNGEFMYLTSKNIRFGFLDLSNMEFINQKQHLEIYKRCSVKYGDVLLTKDGAKTGNAAINNIKEQFSLLSSVCLLRGKEGVLDNNFLLNLLLCERGQKMIKDSMSGLAITRVTLTIINKLIIPIPPLQEQVAISNRIKNLENNTNYFRQQLSKLHALKTGLMQDLLSGKVRVNVKAPQIA
jgi:type I restriction enzyme S subunit